MSISSEQAAEALRMVEQAGARSSTLYGYRKASPYLLLWGVIWLIGFVTNDFFVSHTNTIWIPLDIVGIAGSTYIGVKEGRGHCQAGRRATTSGTLQWLASIFTVLAFYVTVQIVMSPVVDRQAATLMALIVAMFYVLAGLARSPRLGVTGVVIAALSLFGYYKVLAHFNLWMGVVVGGALILAGFWLRRS